MIQEEEIPDYWQMMTLGDVVEYHSNLMEPQDGTSYDLIELDDLEQEAGGITNIQKKDGKDIGSSKRKFNNEHVLYCKLRPYLNKVAKPEFSGIASSELLVLEPSERITRDYLFHYLSSPMIRDRAEFLMKGANHPRISKTELLNFKIPIPPLEEQKQIVERIDDTIREMRDLRKSIDVLESLTGEYKDSLLSFLFAGKTDLTSESPESISDESQLPNNWDLKDISEIALEMNTGSTPSRSNKEYWGGEIKWAKAGEISSAGKYIADTEERVTEKASENTYGEDYVFVTIIGANLSSVVLPKDEMAINQQNVSVKLNDEVDREYFYYYIQNIGDYLQELGRGGGQQAINQTVLGNVEIPLPPLDEQRRIVEQVESIDMTRVNRAINYVDDLFDEYRDSVLAHAFKGELIDIEAEDRDTENPNEDESEVSRPEFDGEGQQSLEQIAGSSK